MCQRLLEGDPQILTTLGENAFPNAPPRLMRVSTLAMTPSHPEVRRATGDYWHTQRLGVIVAPHGKSDWPDALSLPEAEVFHPDWLRYKRNAAPLKAMVRAYQQGMEANRAILVQTDLTEHGVRTFWEDFLPLTNEGRGDFARHNQKAAELTERFGKLQVARFERVLERFAWLLRQRTECHQFADALPNLPITSTRDHQAPERRALHPGLLPAARLRDGDYARTCPAGAKNATPAHQSPASIRQIPRLLPTKPCRARPP